MFGKFEILLPRCQAGVIAVNVGTRRRPEYIVADTVAYGTTFPLEHGRVSPDYMADGVRSRFGLNSGGPRFSQEAQGVSSFDEKQSGLASSDAKGPGSVVWCDFLWRCLSPSRQWLVVA